jgi:hypothetical protein
VFIPLFVEYSKTPLLEIERSDDLNIEYRKPEQRLVHVRTMGCRVKTHSSSL